MEMNARHTGNFTSYMVDEANSWEPKLLSGEIEAARADNVLLYVAQKQKLTKGKSQSADKIGTLIVTNFRLSFTLNENRGIETDVAYQENIFLGKYDISLPNIDKIYQITDKKKRPIGPEHKNSSKVDAIRVICKNFRLLTFDFKNSSMKKGKHIADALLRFAFPSSVNLNFLYQYKVEYYNATRSIRLFRTEDDWIQELQRCKAQIGQNGWRIHNVSRFDQPEASNLPTCFIVPHCLSPNEYVEKSRFFRSNRAAIWVFGLENASLIRMADLLETANDRTEENTMLECVRKCDPERKAPTIIELDKHLPSIQDIYHSYNKLMELCAPESDRQFMIQDSRFYSLMEKSCWLLYISLCLRQATELSRKMRLGETIVLQETEGRDMCCLISSLMQVLLDPYARTINGFQSLIQKEWVSLGHPFCDRMRLINRKGAGDQGPLFLLFLDAVWQLLQQYPDQFEFSETFLTTIWDSVFLPIFDTFQFNCEYDRERAEKENVILRPVWDWGEQFSDKDIALFSNPLYKKSSTVDLDTAGKNRASIVPSSTMQLVTNELKMYIRNKNQADQKSSELSKNIQKLKISIDTQERFLEPKYLIRDLEIWSQCYFRWIPILEVVNGGIPQIDLFTRKLVNKIHSLQKSLVEPISITKQNEQFHNQTTDTQFNVNSFFPFNSNTGNNADLSDLLILNGELLGEGSLYDTTSLAY